VGYSSDDDLPEVSEEAFATARQTVRTFTAVILRPGAAFQPPGPGRSSEFMATVLAHGKRNYALHLAGLMPIICPVADGSDVVGLGVFDASPEDVERIMAADPAVQAGILGYEIHPTWSFPGSTLPAI
jgi:hypothetical protein